MRQTVVLVCALALGGVVATPAFAGCDTDLIATEDAAAKITDVKQKAEAEKHIAMAKSELAAANEKACGEHVAAANAALKTKPGMKP
ncbi:MAG: hypothetical protein ABI661_12050 [Gammaproteobacteria bacterium]